VVKYKSLNISMFENKKKCDFKIVDHM